MTLERSESGSSCPKRHFLSLGNTYKRGGSSASVVEVPARWEISHFRNNWCAHLGWVEGGRIRTLEQSCESRGDMMESRGWIRAREDSGGHTVLAPDFGESRQ